MPAKTYVMGPGSLILGATGSTKEMSCQITAATVSWDADSEDDTALLCGEVEPGADSYTAALSATLFQDLGAVDGITEWSWANKGTTQPITFVPATAADRRIVGVVKIHPIDVGGDAKSKPTSDIEWPFVGEPVIEPLAP